MSMLSAWQKTSAPVPLTGRRIFPPSAGRGFTLVELLVIIFVFGLIGASLMVNYRGGSRASELRQAGDQVISVLRRAQNGALSGYRYDGSTVTTLRTSFEAASSQSYRMCADSQGCATNIIEEVDLPDGMHVDSITYRGPGAVSTESVDIVFSPPYADITFTYRNPSGATITTASGQIDIVLINQAEDTRTITIDAVSGRIEAS